MGISDYGRSVHDTTAAAIQDDELTSPLDPLGDISVLSEKLGDLIERLEQRAAKAQHELNRVNTALRERQAQFAALVNVRRALDEIDSDGKVDIDTTTFRTLVGRGDRE